MRGPAKDKDAVVDAGAKGPARAMQKKKVLPTPGPKDAWHSDCNIPIVQ